VFDEAVEWPTRFTTPFAASPWTFLPGKNLNLTLQRNRDLFALVPFFTTLRRCTPEASSRAAPFLLPPALRNLSSCARDLRVQKEAPNQLNILATSRTFFNLSLCSQHIDLSWSYGDLFSRSHDSDTLPITPCHRISLYFP